MNLLMQNLTLFEVRISEENKFIYCSVMLETEAVFLEKKEYIAGITNNVRNVEKINPPITAIPIETLLSEPAPSASAIGKIPSTVERLVISIGLNLAMAALMTASVFSSPAAFL